LSVLGQHCQIAVPVTTELGEIMSYAEVNGINLYYETHGAGSPLLLLHGGLGSGEMFAPILPAFTT
jgi:hypothetical protein